MPCGWSLSEVATDHEGRQEGGRALRQAAQSVLVEAKDNVLAERLERDVFGGRRPKRGKVAPDRSSLHVSRLVGGRDDDPQLVGAAAPLATEVVRPKAVLARRIARVKVPIDGLPHPQGGRLAPHLNRARNARADVAHPLLALDAEQVDASVAARELARLGAVLLGTKVKPSFA